MHFAECGQLGIISKLPEESVQGGSDSVILLSKVYCHIFMAYCDV